MLWNWNTIDTCFIARSWHVRSSGAFAGSCIGVVLLVILLEGLRRTCKEYDRYLVQQHARRLAAESTSQTPLVADEHRSGSGSPSVGDADAKTPRQHTAVLSNLTQSVFGRSAGSNGFRPSAAQQAIRAALHMVTFAVAYFVML